MSIIRNELFKLQTMKSGYAITRDSDGKTYNGAIHYQVKDELIGGVSTTYFTRYFNEGRKYTLIFASRNEADAYVKDHSLDMTGCKVVRIKRLTKMW